MRGHPTSRSVGKLLEISENISVYRVYDDGNIDQPGHLSDREPIWPLCLFAAWNDYFEQ